MAGYRTVSSTSALTGGGTGGGIGIAAPDLAEVYAGHYDAEAGTFSTTLVWDALNEKLQIDFKAVLPASLSNWDSWRLILRVPNDGEFDYLFEGEPYSRAAFAPPEPGGEMFGTVGLSGNDLPEAEETWRLIFVSINEALEMNRDAEDLPTGPYVDVTIPARPEQVVFEKPGKPTGLDFSVAAVADAIGVSEVTVALFPPVDDITIGVQLWLEAPSGTNPRDMGSFDFVGTGVQQFKFRYETPSSTTSWKLWASPYTKFYASRLTTSGPDADPFIVRIVSGQAAVSAAMQVVAGVLGVAPGGITNALIGTFAVATANLQDAAVATAKLEDGVITTVKIGDRAVTALKIALLAVESANIANAAITTAKIANLAITNALIANAAITDAKINDLSANKIGAGTITAAVSMTAPTLLITSGTVTVNIDATNKIKITDTTFKRFTQITGTQFRVESSSDTTFFAVLNLGSIGMRRPLSGADVTIQMTNAGIGSSFEINNLNSPFEAMKLDVGSLSFNTTQVLKARRTGWTVPLGTRTRTGYTTSTATVTQVAEALCALIEDLSATHHGIIGA